MTTVLVGLRRKGNDNDNGKGNSRSLRDDKQTEGFIFAAGFLVRGAFLRGRLCLRVGREAGARGLRLRWRGRARAGCPDRRPGRVRVGNRVSFDDRGQPTAPYIESSTLNCAD